MLHAWQLSSPAVQQGQQLSGMPGSQPPAPLAGATLTAVSLTSGTTGQPSFLAVSPLPHGLPPQQPFPPSAFPQQPQQQLLPALELHEVDAAAVQGQQHQSVINGWRPTSTGAPLGPQARAPWDQGRHQAWQQQAPQPSWQQHQQGWSGWGAGLQDFPGERLERGGPNGALEPSWHLPQQLQQHETAQQQQGWSMWGAGLQDFPGERPERGWADGPVEPSRHLPQQLQQQKGAQQQQAQQQERAQGGSTGQHGRPRSWGSGSAEGAWKQSLEQRSERGEQRRSPERVGERHLSLERGRSPGGRAKDLGGMGRQLSLGYRGREWQPSLGGGGRGRQLSLERERSPGGSTREQHHSQGGKCRERQLSLERGSSPGRRGRERELSLERGRSPGGRGREQHQSLGCRGRGRQLSLERGRSPGGRGSEWHQSQERGRSPNKRGKDLGAEQRRGDEGHAALPPHVREGKGEQRGGGSRQGERHEATLPRSRDKGGGAGSGGRGRQQHSPSSRGQAATQAMQALRPGSRGPRREVRRPREQQHSRERGREITSRGSQRPGEEERAASVGCSKGREGGPAREAGGSRGGEERPRSRVSSRGGSVSARAQQGSREGGGRHTVAELQVRAAPRQGRAPSAAAQPSGPAVRIHAEAASFFGSPPSPSRDAELFMPGLQSPADKVQPQMLSNQQQQGRRQAAQQGQGQELPASATVSASERTITSGLPPRASELRPAMRPQKQGRQQVMEGLGNEGQRAAGSLGHRQPWAALSDAQQAQQAHPWRQRWGEPLAAPSPAPAQQAEHEGAVHQQAQQVQEAAQEMHPQGEAQQAEQAEAGAGSESRHLQHLLPAFMLPSFPEPGPRSPATQPLLSPAPVCQQAQQDSSVLCGDQGPGYAIPALSKPQHTQQQQQQQQEGPIAELPPHLSHLQAQPFWPVQPQPKLAAQPQVLPPHLSHLQAQHSRPVVTRPRLAGQPQAAPAVQPRLQLAGQTQAPPFPPQMALQAPALGPVPMQPQGGSNLPQMMLSSKRGPVPAAMQPQLQSPPSAAQPLPMLAAQQRPLGPHPAQKHVPSVALSPETGAVLSTERVQGVFAEALPPGLEASGAQPKPAPPFERLIGAARDPRRRPPLGPSLTQPASAQSANANAPASAAAPSHARAAGQVAQPAALPGSGASSNTASLGGLQQKSCVPGWHPTSPQVPSALQGPTAGPSVMPSQGGAGPEALHGGLPQQQQRAEQFVGSRRAPRQAGQQQQQRAERNRTRWGPQLPEKALPPDAAPAPAAASAPTSAAAIAAAGRALARQGQAAARQKRAPGRVPSEGSPRESPPGSPPRRAQAPAAAAQPAALTQPALAQQPPAQQEQQQMQQLEGRCQPQPPLQGRDGSVGMQAKGSGAACPRPRLSRWDRAVHPTSLPADPPSGGPCGSSQEAANSSAVIGSRAAQQTLPPIPKPEAQPLLAQPMPSPAVDGDGGRVAGEGSVRDGTLTAQGEGRGAVMGAAAGVGEAAAAAPVARTRPSRWGVEGQPSPQQKEEPQHQRSPQRPPSAPQKEQPWQRAPFARGEDQPPPPQKEHPWQQIPLAEGQDHQGAVCAASPAVCTASAAPSTGLSAPGERQAGMAEPSHPAPPHPPLPAPGHQSASPSQPASSISQQAAAAGVAPMEAREQPAQRSKEEPMQGPGQGLLLLCLLPSLLVVVAAQQAQRDTAKQAQQKPSAPPLLHLALLRAWQHAKAAGAAEAPAAMQAEAGQQPSKAEPEPPQPFLLCSPQSRQAQPPVLEVMLAQAKAAASEGRQQGSAARALSSPGSQRRKAGQPARVWAPHAASPQPPAVAGAVLAGGSAAGRGPASQQQQHGGKRPSGCGGGSAGRGRGPLTPTLDPPSPKLAGSSGTAAADGGQALAGKKEGGGSASKRAKARGSAGGAAAAGEDTEPPKQEVGEGQGPSTSDLIRAAMLGLRVRKSPAKRQQAQQGPGPKRQRAPTPGRGGQVKRLAKDSGENGGPQAKKQRVPTPLEQQQQQQQAEAGQPEQQQQAQQAQQEGQQPGLSASVSQPAPAASRESCDLLSPAATVANATEAAANPTVTEEASAAAAAAAIAACGRRSCRPTATAATTGAAATVHPATPAAAAALGSTGGFGAEVVGRRVLVHWPGQGWFEGAITKFTGRTHQIRYDDGDIQVGVRLGAERFVFMDD